MPERVVQHVFILLQVVVNPADIKGRTVDQVIAKSPDYTAPVRAAG